MTDGLLLLLALEPAVLLRVEEFRRTPWEVLSQRATAAGDVIAHHGDNILYRGQRKGDTATAFNALAEAIAILSFVPGGVTFLGRHWDSVHPEVPKEGMYGS